MKERIEKMIETLKSGIYDQEGCHVRYDKLLEDYIKNPDLTLLALMQYLIEQEKDFWYA